MSDIDLTEATNAAHKALAARWMTVASALAEDEDYPQILTDVLHAALPAIREQLARQIETLPNLSLPGYFATRPIGLIRKDTAARIVRGER